MNDTTKRTISIDRIAVRLSGIHSQCGREAVNGLGDALASALADRFAGARESVRIPDIQAKADPAAAPRTPEQLRAAIVDAVARKVSES